MVRIGGQPLGFGEPRGVQHWGMRGLALPSASKHQGTQVVQSHCVSVPCSIGGETEAWGA